MNTNKSLLPDPGLVERVTIIAKAYAHPLRYEIIQLLLERDSMTPQEMAAHFKKPESFLFEQISLLCACGLIESDLSNGNIYLSANGTKILQVRQSISSFLRD